MPTAVVATTLAALTGGGAVHAATIGPVKALPACPTELGANADGSVRVLTRTQARGRASSVVSVVDPAGATTTGIGLSRPWRTPNAVRSVMTEGGVTVAFESGKRKPPEYDVTPNLDDVVIGAPSAARSETVSVATKRPDGSVRTQLLSARGRDADLYKIVSRGGTTVVSFRQSVPGKLWLQDWVAVRPRGAADFLPAVSLKSSLRDKFGLDEVALGADGTGVVLSTPTDRKLPITARRIDAAGAVGAPIPLGRHQTVNAVAHAAVAPNGDVVVAIVETERRDLRGKAGVYAAMLPAGGPAFSEPRLLGTERYDTGTIGDNLAIAVDDAGRVTVVTGRIFKGDTRDYDQGLQTYAGAGDALTRGPFVPTLGADDPVLTPIAGGGIALTWEGYVLGTQKIAQHVAFGAADGTWSAPQPVSPPFTWTLASFATDRGITALPSGGIALAYAIERSGRRTRCALVRVAP